jgi:protein gp37
MAKRLGEMGKAGYPKRQPFKVRFHSDRLGEPSGWKRPRVIFVCSMGDIAHPDVKDEWLIAVWREMECCPWHRFLILTKRIVELLRRMDNLRLRYLEHVGIGVTAEDQAAWDSRVPFLCQASAPLLWVSCEPMLSAIEPKLWDYCRWEGDRWHSRGAYPIGWIICGGETGRQAVPMHPEWPRRLRDDCRYLGVPFFFKRWGTDRPEHGNRGRLLDGKLCAERPEFLQVG